MEHKQLTKEELKAKRAQEKEMIQKMWERSVENMKKKNAEKAAE